MQAAAGEFDACAWEAYMGQRCFNPQVENSLHSFKQVCLSLMLSSLELITTTETSCSVQLVMWVSHSPGIVPLFFCTQLAARHSVYKFKFSYRYGCGQKYCSELVNAPNPI